jgi:hypothetical protein
VRLINFVASGLAQRFVGDFAGIAEANVARAQIFRVESRHVREHVAQEVCADVCCARVVQGELVSGEVARGAHEVCIRERVEVNAEQRGLLKFLRRRGHRLCGLGETQKCAACRFRCRLL